MSSTNPVDKLTEWDQLQIKYGNFEAPQKQITEQELTNIAVDYAEQHDPLAGKSLAQLDELEDVVEEDTLEAYRQKRISEMKQRAARARFGDVIHISKQDYQSEVSNASKEGTEGTWVVLHMYKDLLIECQKLNGVFAELARKFPEVKFVKGISTDIVENYPDTKLPTVLLYRGGTCKHGIHGSSAWGGKGKKGAGGISVARVEAGLAKLKVVETTLTTEDLSDLDDEEDEEGARKRGGTTKYGASELYGSRQRVDEDDEDDERRCNDREFSSLKMEHLRIG
eukprot:Selendium_serpulae@DN2619_c0_g1_i1.p1